MPSLDPLTRGEKAKLTRLASDLLEWAREHGRTFPWREVDTSTYEKIVVEVLLQRTTATAVARFYRDFFDSFPDWPTLAGAEVEDLENYLRPLGLWRRRAVALLGLARYARDRHGVFPTSAAEHDDIPAVGQYVSNAILTFQYGKALPLLDVNMARVIERFVRPRRLADIRYDPWLQAAARWYSTGNDSVLKSWAILDFAALVCKARKPLCPKCPVNSRCSYFGKSKGQCESRAGK